MTIIDVTIKGTRPLLMNSPSNIGERMASKRKKTVYDPEEEAESVTYRNDDNLLCIPSLNVLAMMRKAATNFKAPGRGKKTLKDFVYSGLTIPDEMIVLTPQEYAIDARPVVIARSRVMKWRPKIKDWSLSFQIEILDESIWDPSTVKSVLEESGKFFGLLDFRPFYGTFVIEKMEVNGRKVK